MPNTVPDEELHVVAGVLRNERGQVLITQRLPHTHQGGKWEFPGGKCEPGEHPGQALQRELREELGVTVQNLQPRIQVRHDYQDRRVYLDVYDVTAYEGRPHGREGQAMRWVMPDELKQFEYPAANLPVITSLLLPAVYVITSIEALGEKHIINRLEELLDSGIRLFQFREHTLPPDEFSRIATRFIALAHAGGARVMLNTDSTEVVAQLGADGMHLTSEALFRCERRPLPDNLLVAASCHDAEELKQAEKLQLDFVVLSPVKQTSSHPQSPPLGWDRFARLAHSCRLPVYALGGMKLEDVEMARQHGAQGVAVLSAAWEST